MKKKLTDTVLRNAKPPPAGKRLEIWDTLLPGFGFRVTDKDARSFFVMYRVGPKGSRRQRRYLIGNAKAISLAEARRKARDALRMVEVGQDPAGDNGALVPSPAAATVKAIAQAYLEQHVRKNCRPATLKETQRIFDADVLPAWGGKQLATITRGDVRDLLATITERGAETQANRTLARLKTFFAWTVDNEKLAVSPVERMRPPTKEFSRDRVLSDDELRWFWAATAPDKLGLPFGPLFRLLLVTAQRRDEVGDMDWRELEFASRTWIVPGVRAKNGKPNDVALSQLALEIIADLPIFEAPDDLSDRFIFTTTGKSPVSGYSRAKANLDSLMEAERRKEKRLPDDAKPAIAPWILHDLRRTAATGMARLQVQPQVVDKILNHISGTIRGVAAVYNRFEYETARTEALEAWGDYLVALNRPIAANVVRLQVPA